jgi:hypothetical protein
MSEVRVSVAWRGGKLARVRKAILWGRPNAGHLCWGLLADANS